MASGEGPSARLTGRLTIYLDDCADHNRLAEVLCQAGHRVVIPRIAGTGSIDDGQHLAYATEHEYALLTLNPRDFEILHEERHARGETHGGILLIYRENDVTKDMDYADIVRAIEKLIDSGLPIANELHILNQWR